MRFTYSAILLALSTAATHVAATPFKFPLPDGFPNPSPAQLAIIQKEAGGTLPNGPLPTILKSAGVTTLQLLALNEIFEVAYFTELLTNVTNGVPGYDAKSIAPLDKAYVVKALTAVVNVSLTHQAAVAWIALFQLADRFDSKRNCMPWGLMASSRMPTAPRSNPASTNSQSPPSIKP